MHPHWIEDFKSYWLQTFTFFKIVFYSKLLYLKGNVKIVNNTYISFNFLFLDTIYQIFNSFYIGKK